MTSTTHTPDFWGVAGGDAVCATRATAAGLSGTFKAYVGGNGQEPWERVTGGECGWINVRPDSSAFLLSSGVVKGGSSCGELVTVGVDKSASLADH